MRPNLLSVTFFVALFTIKIYGQSIGNVTLPSNDRVSKDNSINETNVDLSTGVITPSIHLMDLKGKGNLNVSVDLVYKGGQGLKVNDVAGKYGWGWDISAGGSVTRQVRGIRDEEEHLNPIYSTDGPNKYGWLDNINLAENHVFRYEVEHNQSCGVINVNYELDGISMGNWNSNSFSSWCFNHGSQNTSTDLCGGYPVIEDVEYYHCNLLSETHMVGDLVNYFHQNTPPVNYTCDNCWWLAIEKYFTGTQSDHQYTDYTIDSEPDVFSFSFGGYSGQFIFDENGYPQLIPQQDIKVEPALGPHKTQYGSDDAWIFTTPDGVRYIFKNTDAFTETTTLGRDYSGTSNTNSKEFISTWHLSRVVDADENSIFFTYSSDGWKKGINGPIESEGLENNILSQMEPAYISGSDIDAFKNGNTSAHCAVPFQYTDITGTTPKL